MVLGGGGAEYNDTAFRGAEKEEYSAVFFFIYAMSFFICIFAFRI